MAPREDSRTTEELIAAAIAEEDDNNYWEIVRVLHGRATRKMFDTAVSLTRSADVDERCLGVDILAQIGAGDRLFPDQIKEIFLDLLERETHEDVLGGIGFGTGHNPDFNIIEPLVALRSHPSRYVRRGVVSGLSGHEDQAAIDAMIELSADCEEDIRDWAVFGLAQQLDADTPEIREALFRRLGDESPSVRAGAVFGLARRGDERAIDALARELRTLPELDEWYVFDLDSLFEAATFIPDSSLYSALVAAKESGLMGDYSNLDHAIALTRTPSPDEFDQPDDQPATCLVCGLRDVFTGDNEWGFCPRCGWENVALQREDPELKDECWVRSVNEERARWRDRLEAGRNQGTGR